MRKKIEKKKQPNETLELYRVYYTHTRALYKRLVEDFILILNSYILCVLDRSRLIHMLSSIQF